MRISLNGQAHEVAEESTLADLLATLKLSQARVAVERNRRIVPTPERAAERLRPGDTIEIVAFVGGG